MGIQGLKRTLIVIAACAAAACSRPADETSRAIVLWEQDDARIAPYIDSVIEAFKKLPGNSDLEITRTHYQTEDLRQRFQAASLAGVPPDLLLCPSDTAGLFAVSGFIMPLEAEFDLSRYNKTVVDAITLDGHAWGVPVTNGNHLMMFYNRRLVKKQPATTDELFSFCREEAPALKLDACLAFDMGEPFWLMPWLGAFGGAPMSGKTPTLDTRAMRDALGFYLDLKFEKKFVPKECDYNCMDSLFKEARTAFIINGDWAISEYQRHLGRDLGICLIPKLSPTGAYPSPMVSGKYFMLSSGIKPEKMAVIKSFVEFYTSRENQIRQYLELKRLPALTSANSAPEITSDPVSRISMEQILKGRPMPMATEMRAVWDTARNYMGLAMSRKMDADTAAERMQEEALRKIEDMDR